MFSISGNKRRREMIARGPKWLDWPPVFSLFFFLQFSHSMNLLTAGPAQYKWMKYVHRAINAQVLCVLSFCHHYITPAAEPKRDSNHFAISQFFLEHTHEIICKTILYLFNIHIWPFGRTHWHADCRCRPITPVCHQTFVVVAERTCEFLLVLFN